MILAHQLLFINGLFELYQGQNQNVSIPVTVIKKRKALRIFKLK